MLLRARLKIHHMLPVGTNQSLFRNTTIPSRIPCIQRERILMLNLVRWLSGCSSASVERGKGERGKGVEYMLI